MKTLSRLFLDGLRVGFQGLILFFQLLVLLFERPVLFLQLAMLFPLLLIDHEPIGAKYYMVSERHRQKADRTRRQLAPRTIQPLDETFPKIVQVLLQEKIQT